MSSGGTGWIGSWKRNSRRIWRRRRSTGDPWTKRAFGRTLQYRERSRDLKLAPWADSLVADAVFGWRQLRKRTAASLAAILSLGLAIGATTAVYRIVDALLLRPLPIAEPDRFFYIATTYVDRDGKPDYRDEL